MQTDSIRGLGGGKIRPRSVINFRIKLGCLGPGNSRLNADPDKTIVVVQRLARVQRREPTFSESRLSRVSSFAPNGIAHCVDRNLVCELSDQSGADTS